MLTIKKTSEIETRAWNLKLHNFVPPIVDAFISCKDQSIAAHAAPLLQLECPHQYSGKIRTFSIFWLKKCRPQLSVIWCLATGRTATISRSSSSGVPSDQGPPDRRPAQAVRIRLLHGRPRHDVQQHQPIGGGAGPPHWRAARAAHAQLELNTHALPLDDK